MRTATTNILHFRISTLKLFRNILCCSFIFTLFNSRAAIYTVDNVLTTDNGLAYTAGDNTNSFRKCLRLANASAGLDSIYFNITSVAPYVIPVATSTQAFTGPVFIDGYTQAGALPGSPVVQFSGTGAIDMFQFNAGSSGSTLKGLIIYGNNCTSGLRINASSNNTITGNFFGPNLAGTSAGSSPNLQVGIIITGASSNNIIGGTQGISTRNIISSNARGLQIQTNVSNTTVVGNYFGLNATGTGALANTNYSIEGLCQGAITIGGSTYASRNYIAGNTAVGIRITNCTTLVVKGNFIGIAPNNTAINNSAAAIDLQNPTSNVTIGGPSPMERNVIGGNTLGITANTCTGISITNNYFGTDSTGLILRTNTQHNITLNTCSNITVGGTSYATRNIIAGSNQDGLRLTNCNTATIKGNFIGLGSNGTTLINNVNHGINLQTTNANVVIGGPTRMERNVIGGNQCGITGIAPGITIVNNYIGTDSTGLVAKTNSQQGINLSSSNNITIGGISYAYRNVICGNQSDGIRATTCTTVVIKGNFIGLGADGKTSINNSGNGINMQNPTSAVVIGGTTPEERNVIGSNNTNGILANTSHGISFKNNYIGTDSTGIVAKANTQCGINLNTCNNAAIGGSAYAERNVICSNGQQGINIINSSSPVIKGNFIGIGANGNTSLGNVNNGINLQNPTSSVVIGGTTHPERNIISGNSGVGVSGATVTSITFYNNYIGVDSTGLLARGNLQGGITLSPASNVVIGGANYNMRNVIAGNTQNAINITNGTTVTIKGNFLGLTANGGALGNTQSGILLQTASSNVTIGGYTIPERNIIGSNGANGISANNSPGILIVNNYIGTDTTGMLARGNGNNGINLTGGCNNAVIGGTTYAARNIVTSNTQEGIRVQTCNTLTIKGNFIGLAVDGTTARGNLQSGINLLNPTSNVSIGGITHPERNVIGSNGQRGISANTCTGITIYNNYIGVDSTGMLARANGQNNIEIAASSTVLIGGASYAMRNIISNSTNGNGISLSTCSTAVEIKGNFIGFAKDGITAMGNRNSGIQISTSTPVTVGGPTPAERNIIGSNQQNGINVTNSAVVSIQNNYVGTDSTGMLARGNSENGIRCSTISGGLTIGGATTNLRNISSSNLQNGIYVNQAPGVIIKGNIVGLAIDGQSIRGNTQHGVSIDQSLKPIVGGLTVAERNLIACSGQQGLQINNSDTALVQGNYIGTDVTGLLNRGNAYNGMTFNTCRDVQVGGVNYAPRNLVCGSGQDGIRFGGNCPRAIIKGNFCGLGADGSTIISNLQSGIHLAWSGSDGAIIGGSVYSERNVCSGNGTTIVYSDSRDGIRIDGGSSNHIIKGNYCGVDSTGTLPRGNVWAGISLNECKNLIVGGTGPFEANIASDNFHEGFYLRNDTNCTLIANKVGTDITGTLDLGNHDFGINIRYRNYMNFIGGGTEAEGNIVAYTKNITNIGSGIFVDSFGTRQKIVRNKIFCNAERGIQLENLLTNEGIQAPVMVSSDANTVSGTGAIDGDSIHIYRNFKKGGYCDCEGETYLGGTVVSGGTWSFTHNLNLTGTQIEDLTATETTINGSTSEFSDCFVPLPVHLIAFNVEKNTSSTALVTWATASEENNHHFEVQRSTDGVHFETIGTVKGAGNSSAQLNYTFIDYTPSQGINYYKLVQVDFDNKSTSSEIKSLNFSVNALAIIPSANGFSILVGGDTESEIRYQVSTVTGAVILEKEIIIPAGESKTDISLTLSEAMYIVTAVSAKGSDTERIIVK